MPGDFLEKKSTHTTIRITELHNYIFEANWSRGSCLMIGHINRDK